MQVFPGDSINVASTSASAVNGIHYSPQTGSISTRAGVLHSVGSRGAEAMDVDGASGSGSRSDKEKFTVAVPEQRRYLASSGDSVIGQIIFRGAEGYRVDIGTASTANLDALAFEGATKRNKPNLKVGSLIYARVSLAHKDMETELECLNPATGKAEGYGELKGGLLADNININHCKSLLEKKSSFMNTLMQGFSFPFELATGLNGKIWISASSPAQTIAVYRTILRADKEGVDALTDDWFAEVQD
ncbi:hypothetical protein E3P99_00406 [Wallemia hederae]|uniref:Ribosomal RNA-processing protein 40 n=1 Tax=Wallemia hederae TaxID=1540922 RepID=A0A4T0FYH5_9BASI|nr:hypothetical protein E3P99_00406 [Wallemia hederae]